MPYTKHMLCISLIHIALSVLALAATSAGIFVFRADAEGWYKVFILFTALAFGAFTVLAFLPLWLGYRYMPTDLPWRMVWIFGVAYAVTIVAMLSFYYLTQ